jgi:hypothetical protein
MDNDKTTHNDKPQFREQVDDMQRREQQRQRKADEAKPSFDLEELDHDKHD